MEGADFYEVRANQDLRIIASLFNGAPVCYAVDHHDAALRRAGRLSILPNAIPKQWQDRPALEKLDSQSLSHLDDQALKENFSVPSAWISAVRAFPTSSALTDSGIDEVIGIENTFRLAAEYELDDQLTSLQIIKSGLFEYSIEFFAKAMVVDQVIIISPILSYPTAGKAIACFLDILRTRRFRTIIITRDLDNKEHNELLVAFSDIAGTEVLINDGIGSELIACLAPSPWGFAGISTFDRSLDQNGNVGIFVPSRSGEQQIIRGIGETALELRTAINTYRYPVI